MYFLQKPVLIYNKKCYTKLSEGEIFPNHNFLILSSNACYCYGA